MKKNEELEVVYPIRINRYLALQKICSRREADQFIAEGKIAINGQIAKLGDKVNADDKVEVVKALGKEYVYLAFNKPKGIITHSPQGGEKSIEDVVKYSPKVSPVGRLDKDSWGLIILSNDGRIVDSILNPEREHEKEYSVTVNKLVEPEFVKKMSAGVRLDDGYLTKKCVVRKKSPFTFSIVLTEGKKHQIRRMCQELGYNTVDLKRVRVLNVEIGTVLPGQYRKIEGPELEEFLKLMGISSL
jgi:23S rRNA pseudouridine2604 synthase